MNGQREQWTLHATQSDFHVLSLAEAVPLHQSDIEIFLLLGDSIATKALKRHVEWGSTNMK